MWCCVVSAAKPFSLHRKEKQTRSSAIFFAKKLIQAISTETQLKSQREQFD